LGVWLLLSQIVLSQKCSKLRNDSIEKSEVDNHSVKRDFADVLEDAKSVVVFSLSRQFFSRVRRNDVTNTAWLPAF